MAKPLSNKMRKEIADLTAPAKKAAAPQDAAVVVKRTRKPAAAVKPVVTDKTKNTAVVNGVPCALIEKQVSKGRAAAKRKMFDQKQAEAFAKPVVDHIAESTKKVAAKKPAAVKSSPSASRRATRPQKSSTQSTTSSAPIAAKVTPDGGKPQAIAAAAIQGALALNPNGSDAVTRKDISKVLSTQVHGDMGQRMTKINPGPFLNVLGDAASRTGRTLLRFRSNDRANLRPFVTFFERFWGVIEHRVELPGLYSKAQFAEYLETKVPVELAHGEYARYSFECGTRAIVLHTFAGSAVMLIEENEFIAALKKMPVSITSPHLVSEQAQKNPSVFVFSSTLPFGLSALVRSELAGGLSLAVLNRVFGDPIDYALMYVDCNLADQVEDLLEVLVDREAQAPRRPQQAA